MDRSDLTFINDLCRYAEQKGSLETNKDALRAIRLFTDAKLWPGIVSAPSPVPCVDPPGSQDSASPYPVACSIT